MILIYVRIPLPFRRGFGQFAPAGRREFSVILHKACENPRHGEVPSLSTSPSAPTVAPRPRDAGAVAPLYKRVVIASAIT